MSRYEVCYRCYTHRTAEHPTADRVGSLIYGIDGTQSGHTMYSYKARPASADAKLLVSLLAVTAVNLHLRCAHMLSGVPVTHWATVPSLKPDRIGQGEHPLHQIFAVPMRSIPEVGVRANPPIQDARALDPSNFVITSPVPRGAHLVAIDDTWTSGGHVQSVAAALKLAGAGQVSILTIARWLKIDASAGDAGSDLRAKIREQVYDPVYCPWTAGGCP